MLTEAQMNELVRKGWDKVTQGVLDDLTKRDMIREYLYHTESIDKAYYEEWGVTTLGDIPRFDGTLEYADVYPDWGKRIEPAEFALGVELEKKFWADNLYNVCKDWATQFATSLHRTKEKTAVKGYATLNSSAFEFQSWNEEGVPICSTSHKTKVPGVSTATGFSNFGTAAFSPLSLEATRLIMRGTKLPNGQYAFLKPNGLLGATTMERAFEEVIGTAKGLYTADGTINVQHTRGWEFRTHQFFNDYLPNTNSWVVVDWDAARNFALWVNRQEKEDGAHIDFETYRLKFKVYARFGYGFRSWPGFYFNQPAI